MHSYVKIFWYFLAHVWILYTQYNESIQNIHFVRSSTYKQENVAFLYNTFLSIGMQIAYEFGIIFVFFELQFRINVYL